MDCCESEKCEECELFLCLAPSQTVQFLFSSLLILNCFLFNGITELVIGHKSQITSAGNCFGQEQNEFSHCELFV